MIVAAIETTRGEIVENDELPAWIAGLDKAEVTELVMDLATLYTAASTHKMNVA